MIGWETSEPPLGTEIEYERDDGFIDRGQLVRAGQFGIGSIAIPAPLLRQQYVRNGGEVMFEVTRWRRVD